MGAGTSILVMLIAVFLPLLVLARGISSEPWGLLDKTNPRATVSSTAAHALGWSIVGAIGYGSLIYWFGWSVNYWLFWTIFLGFCGGLMEWQLDDGPDDDDISTPPPAKMPD